ncbi:hypothetical protein WME90_23045 [Sorangium sp. So ce375]|uniref:tetratricopeptide repeat protein n=1 Tax=Sorangium sp. So ce375 TaxID=3133306 RepID=UPI003F5C1B03
MPVVAGAAGAKDAEAMKLHNQAMDDDYLSVEFDKAEKKLKDALKKCDKNACSKPVVGKLHIALGTVYGGGNKLDQAKAEFVLALQADPKAALIDALTTTELAQAFKEAQKEAQAAGKAERAPGEGGGKSTKAAGDVPHTPVAEQAVNTPVPVYVEIPEEIDASKATLRYKPFGSPKWKSLEMSRIERGFGAEIPCEDVTTTGDIRYFVILRDEAGDPVGTAGSMQAPHRVPIKNEIDEEPSLPGQEPPKRCAAKEDCPPGLPGCPEAGGARGDKTWGAACEATVECQSGLTCLNGTCEQGSDEGRGASRGKGNRNVIGLSGSLDLLLVRGTDYVCSGSDAAYACFYPGGGGRQFYGEPADLPDTNGVKGGLSLAGWRAMLSYDRQLFSDVPLLVGVRAGFAFGGSPDSKSAPSAWTDATGNPQENPHLQALSFLPLHGELRATYFFLGDRIVEKGGFRPYAFVSPIGLAQVNASVPVDVCDRRTEEGDLVRTSGSERCPPNTRHVEDLDAYQITGRNFSALGAGVVYGITSNLGVSAEVKVMLMWPTLGLVFAPTLGPVFAF